MDIRKDFSSATLYLERLLLFRDEFKKNNLEEWSHLKNKEDFNKVYEMDDDTRYKFERIYSEGRDLSVDMTFKLEEFNNVLEHPSLTSYLLSFYDKNKNFWNVKELEEISLQARQKRDELGYDCPWAVEQMILLFDKQINLLHNVAKTLELIKTTDIYKIENKKSVTAKPLDKSRKQKNTRVSKNRDPQHQTQIIVAIIGVVGVIVAALIGILPSIKQPKDTHTPTIVALTDTLIPPTTIPARLIFSDAFDNNNNDWHVDQVAGDFNSSGYKTFVHIDNGKYYREMESINDFTHIYGAQPIPNVSEKNFCLVFDARASDSPQDTAIVIIVRAIEWKSYYYIGFNANGGGAVRLVDKQIGKWENGITWTDEQKHNVKISFQDNELEIYNGQTNTLLYGPSLEGDDLLTNSGEIKFGLELFHPNQKATVEFDNVFIYDKCP